MLIPISWNNPASVPNETTCLELSPVKLEINSQASDLSCLSNPTISPIISFSIEALGKIFFISGNNASFAYLSISWFKNTPSSLTTGRVSQLTWHLSAITLWAIPPNTPPIERVEWGGSKIEFLGTLLLSFSLSSINLFTYRDASRYVNKLIELREKLKSRVPKNSIFDPPHSTLSIGGVFGGIAHNVIADKCHVNWETRPVVKEDGVFLNLEIDKYAYLSISRFKNTPSSLTTGRVSQLTWHLSAITLWAIPPNTPPIERVEWGGSKIEFLGTLLLSFSLSSINLFTYRDASRYVNKLIELREKLKSRVPKNSIFDPPHSTLSIGGVFGGIAHNVIADKCHVNWETRPVVKEDGVFLNQEIDKYANEALLPEMKKIFPNASIEKDIIGEIVGFDRQDKSDACELISSLTGDNSRQVVSFGTEAGLFQEIGISTVVCGPGSIEQAHKIDEFIVLDELKKCLDLLDGIKNNSIPN